MGTVRSTLILILAAVCAGCTVSKDTPPPFQGPSELGLSVTLFANPDVLSQDGASQSQIVIETRDSNGQPAPNIAARAEIVVSGTPVDFGRLSARSVVTGSNGRATLTYTAPAPVSSVDTGTIVNIRITPSGTNQSNAVGRVVNIRLVPPGVIIAGGPIPKFTVTPATPTPFTDTLFDASTSLAAAGTALVSFNWNFGDGGTASGIVVPHQFAAGTFTVTLTVTDTNGIAASMLQSVAVSAGTPPAASFVYSPKNPVTNQAIFFDATQSLAVPPRKITRYDWNFGTGSSQSGVTVSKAYDTAGIYSVVLTVTDDVGQTATTTQGITVVPNADSVVTARFTFAPSPAIVGQPVTFDASASSTTSPAGTIVRYEWNFNDGSNPVTGTTSPKIQHIFTQQADQCGNNVQGQPNCAPNQQSGAYTITLKAFDSNGASNSVTQHIVVQ